MFDPTRAAAILSWRATSNSSASSSRQLNSTYVDLGPQTSSSSSQNSTVVTRQPRPSRDEFKRALLSVDRIRADQAIACTCGNRCPALFVEQDVYGVRSMLQQMSQVQEQDWRDDVLKDLDHSTRRLYFNGKDMCLNGWWVILCVTSPTVQSLLR
jgi:hypothetical protein